MNTYDGSKWVASHQASVDAILDGSEGREKRPVSARGDQFFNKDRWTARSLWSKLVQSIRYGNSLSIDMVDDAVRHANSVMIHTPEIVVAGTPDRVPAWLARSSIGGNYHEAWHTEWSCRRDLTSHEVWTPLQQRWALLPEDVWPNYLGAVLTWSNIIEDIRIERLGCAKYPGAPDKMADLQDLILKMEEEGREAAGHKGLPQNEDMAVIMGSFRDLGLGYQSERQLAMLDTYQQRSPAGWNLVTKGALKPLLDASIALDEYDDLGSFYLAMEVVAVLHALGTAQPQPPPQDGPEGQQGQPQQQPDDLSDVTKAKDGEAGNVQTRFPLFAVGDRAKPKTGPYRGKVVEVTFAGLPDKDGRQALKFAVVEPD